MVGRYSSVISAPPLTPNIADESMVCINWLINYGSSAMVASRTVGTVEFVGQQLMLVAVGGHALARPTDRDSWRNSRSFDEQ